MGTETLNPPDALVVRFSISSSSGSSKKKTLIPTGPSTVLFVSAESITVPTRLKVWRAVTWLGINVISTVLPTWTVRFAKLWLPSHLPAPGDSRVSVTSSGACILML